MTPSGDKPLRVAISAGEQSGDILGEGLMTAIELIAQTPRLKESRDLE